MPDTQTRNAACLCGSLRVIARGAPRDVYLCACRNCQKKSGSAFSYAAVFDADAVSVDGEPRRYRYVADSGHWIENAFCPACGGTVFFTGEGLPGLIGIAAGAIEEADLPPPRRMYWCSRRHHWVRVPDGAEEVERQ